MMRMRMTMSRLATVGKNSQPIIGQVNNNTTASRPVVTAAVLKQHATNGQKARRVSIYSNHTTTNAHRLICAQTSVMSCRRRVYYDLRVSISSKIFHCLNYIISTDADCAAEKLHLLPLMRSCGLLRSHCLQQPCRTECDWTPRWNQPRASEAHWTLRSDLR